MSTEIQMLEKRIERIESQNRRLRWLGLTIVAFGLATTAWGQKVKNAAVEAQKFELRDDAGRLRADLAMLNGGPALRFFDSEGTGHSLLSEDQLNFYGKDEDDLTSYAKHGLRVEGEHEKTFVALSADKKGQMGKLWLNDYGSGTYVVVTAQDLAKLVKAKGQ